MAKKPDRLVIKKTLHATPRRPPIARDSRWYWQVYYNHRGTTLRVDGVPSGRYERTQLRELLEAAWDRGDWHSHNKAPEPEVRHETFGDLLGAYLAHCEARRGRGKLSDNSIVTYRHRRRRLGQLPGLEALSLRRPAVRRLQQLADEHSDHPYSAETVRGDWSFVRAAWSWGRSYLPDAVQGELPSIDMPEDDGVYCDYTPTLPEIVRARDALPCPWHQRFMVALMATGGRSDEIGRLRWEVHVAPERGALMLEGKGAGGGRKRPRWIPMAPSLLRALEVQRGEQGGAEKGPVWPALKPHDAFREALRGACARAEVPRFTPHAVRRWVSTEHVARVFGPGGFSAKDYEAWMGHRFEIGLRIYAQSRPVNLDTAAAAVEARLAREMVDLADIG